MLTCSDASRQASEPLAGTAPATRHWMMLSLPAPWPEEIENHPALPDSLRVWLAGKSGGRNSWRFLGLGHLNESGDSGGLHRVLVATRSGTLLAPMRLRSWRMDTEALDTMLKRWIDADGLTAALPPSAEDNAGGNGRHGAPVGLGHWIVCTHGTHDACCGKHGAAWLRGVAKLHNADWPTVWRATHLGGHRFAPTYFSLPDGLCWGRVTDADAKALAGFERWPADLVRRCLRGRLGLGAADQVADAETIARLGKDWLRAESVEPSASAKGWAEETHGDATHKRVVFRARVPEVGDVEVRAEVEQDTPRDIVASCGGEAKPMASWKLKRYTIGKPG